MFQVFLDFWPRVTMMAAALGGAVSFWLNLLKLRQLRRDLATLTAEERALIRHPTPEEVTRYSVSPKEEAIRQTLRAIARARWRGGAALLVSTMLFVPALVLHLRTEGETSAAVFSEGFEILEPIAGEFVEGKVVVAGTAQFPDPAFHIYVLVAPLEASRWFTFGPAMRNNGNWLEIVTLYSGGDRPPRRFRIRAIATRERLETWYVEDLPEDVISTKEIEVHY